VNAIACTALLEGLCHAQDLRQADELLARMELQGPAATPVTYQTYLHGLSKVCVGLNYDRKKKEKERKKGKRKTRVLWPTLQTLISKPQTQNPSVETLNANLTGSVEF